MGPTPVAVSEKPCENVIGRRTFFQWVTYGLSAVALAAAGIPLIGYFVGVRKRSETWVELGPVDAFPVNETRLKNFANPLSLPWDGVTALTGVYVRNLGLDEQGNWQFLVFSMNCAASGLPCLVVPGVRLIHVPMPWRCLLRRRRASFGPSPPRSVPLYVAGARRPTGGPVASLPDLTGPFGDEKGAQHEELAVMRTRRLVRCPFGPALEVWGPC